MSRGVVITGFAKHAIGGTPTGMPPPGAMQWQNVEEAAAAIAAAIDRSAGEIYTNPALHALAVEYVRDVDAFERRAAQVRSSTLE